MQLKDMMTASFESVRPNTTLQAGARKMRDLDVGRLAICGDDDRLAGMFTDRDITCGLSPGQGPANAPVREVISAEIIF